MAAVAIGSGQTFTATSVQTLCTRDAELFRVVCVSPLSLAFLLPPQRNASYAPGNFTNLNGWPDGCTFILSFLAPSWTIGAFDSSVHISEESSNAATAVPWAIVSAIGIAGILGWAINVSLTFCMGTDMDSLLSSPIGQPMAQIFFNSFGQTGTLALWSFVVLVQYMMGSSMVLASSRQTFAFARDGALPFSSYLYRMNGFTKTPVNTVWFVAVISIILSMLSFAGPQAINAIFALSVTALYIAYAIPIVARFVFKNNFKPSPFDLGILCCHFGIVYVHYEHRVFLPDDATNRRWEHELHRGRAGRYTLFLSCGTIALCMAACIGLRAQCQTLGRFWMVNAALLLCAMMVWRERTGGLDTLRYSKAGSPGSKTSMIVRVKPEPSLGNSFSKEKASTSSKIKDLVKNGPMASTPSATQRTTRF
ncbi:amino acid permease-domain-containing protein [Suillus lakei]|nr:amino acid permease-domain-containing protein [Suillus lakei]